MWSAPLGLMRNCSGNLCGCLLLFCSDRGVSQFRLTWFRLLLRNLRRGRRRSIGTMPVLLFLGLLWELDFRLCVVENLGKEVVIFGDVGWGKDGSFVCFSFFFYLLGQQLLFWDCQRIIRLLLIFFKLLFLIRALTVLLNRLQIATLHLPYQEIDALGREVLLDHLARKTFELLKVLE
jgi:hypothetical protein